MVVRVYMSEILNEVRYNQVSIIFHLLRSEVNATSDLVGLTSYLLGSRRGQWR